MGQPSESPCSRVARAISARKNPPSVPGASPGSSGGGGIGGTTSAGGSVGSSAAGTEACSPTVEGAAASAGATGNATVTPLDERGGTGSRAPSNGVAEFGYLRFSAKGTGCTLTATSAGLTSAVSGTFDVQ